MAEMRPLHQKHTARTLNQTSPMAEWVPPKTVPEPWEFTLCFTQRDGRVRVWKGYGSTVNQAVRNFLKQWKSIQFSDSSEN